MEVLLIWIRTMKFCNYCFRDKELKNIIENTSKGHMGDCPICGKKNVFIYDSDYDDYLTPYFEDLLGVFVPEDELPDNFPKSEVRGIVDQIQYYWNVFSEIEAKSQYEIIKSICSGTYLFSETLFTKKLGIPNLYNDGFLKDHSLFKNNSWDDFKTEIKTVNRYHSHKFNFELFERICSFVRKDYHKGDVFYRARISDKNGFPVSDMSAPPAGMSSDGRANAKGIVCLYLANDKTTALHEVRSGLFDYVSVGKFVLQEDITVVNLQGISDISPFLSEMDYIEYAINKKYLFQLDEEMSKAMRRSDSSLDYIPTQYIADFIKSVEHNGKKEYDGIEYKSTTNPNGYNLAIFDSSLFKCESVNVFEITGLDYRCSPPL